MLKYINWLKRAEKCRLFFFWGTPILEITALVDLQSWFMDMRTLRMVGFFVVCVAWGLWGTAANMQSVFSSFASSFLSRCLHLNGKGEGVFEWNWADENDQIIEHLWWIYMSYRKHSSQPSDRSPMSRKSRKREETADEGQFEDQ